jgi:acyl-CoA synthetase (AMP-forming)/AMP-acid ligase II
MLTARHVTDYLFRAAAEYPDRVAVADDHRCLSYARLALRARRVAHGLRVRNLPASASVGLLLPDRSEFVETLFGTWLAGRVAVPLPLLNSTPNALTDYINDTQVRVLVVSGSALSFGVVEQAIEYARRRPEIFVVGGSHPHRAYSDLVTGDAPCTPLEKPSDSLVLIQHRTSVSGQYVGMMFSNAAILAQLAGAMRISSPQHEDRVLCPHAFGTPISFAALMASVGDATTLVTRRFDPARTTRTLATDRITSIWAAAHVLYRLSQHCTVIELAAADLRHLVSFGPPTTGLVGEVERVFKLPVNTFCGPSEAFQMAYVSRTHSHSSQSVGKVHPAFQLKVADDQGREPGKLNALWLKGPTLTSGYWNRPLETAQRLQDGWLWSDELGGIGPEGYVFVRDRIGRTVIRDGQDVPLAAIEEAAWACAEIACACALPGGDVVRDESIALVVAFVDHASLSIAELHAKLSKQLPVEWLPDRYGIVDDMPMTPSGTLNRRAVRELMLQRTWLDAPAGNAFSQETSR